MDPKNVKKEYTNGEVTIVWQSGKCTHSGNCVKNNPDVFKPKEQPWITPENSTTDKIIETIDNNDIKDILIKEKYHINNNDCVNIYNKI